MVAVSVVIKILVIVVVLLGVLLLERCLRVLPIGCILMCVA